MDIDRTRKIFIAIVGTVVIGIIIWSFYKNFSIERKPEPINPTSTSTATNTLSPTDTDTVTPIPTNTPTSTIPPTPTIPSRTINILIDDFNPQPYLGESVYYFNRLQGDRGPVNNSILDWGTGQVTTKISSGNSWGGGWMSLNHPIREGLPINFSAILPPQILPDYQSKIIGITAVIVDGTPGKTFRLELKNGGDLQWKGETVLNSGSQIVSFDLPALGNVNEFLWILDDASADDYVILDNISFTASTQITDTATAAFVWSYGMLLNNWNPDTGLVRNKAKDPSGNFDATQATGSLAATTAMAVQLDIVTHNDAIQIVNKISDALLIDVPCYHGLWPHWVKTTATGEFNIVEGTEWSSIDSVIAAIALLSAKNGLGLDTTDIEQMIQTIDWEDLETPDGISHGYAFSGDLLPYAWDIFGGESWLVALAYAGATDKVAPILYNSPPTANGSGFIDEMAWFFVPPPSSDYWGTDWISYRATAAADQIAYYSIHDSASCFTQAGLFGLSAAEIPYAAMATNGDAYQAFGTGGRFGDPNDGSSLGSPVVIPHYSAMIASLQPEEAIEMWEWLINYEYFSPLNNVESLTFPTSLSCDPDTVAWNSLKGSWNLSLQTLGWGRYLAERNGEQPILWQASIENPLLQKGYLLLTSNESP